MREDFTPLIPASQKQAPSQTNQNLRSESDFEEQLKRRGNINRRHVELFCFQSRSSLPLIHSFRIHCDEVYTSIQCHQKPDRESVSGAHDCAFSVSNHVNPES